MTVYSSSCASDVCLSHWLPLLTRSCLVSLTSLRGGVAKSLLTSTGKQQGCDRRCVSSCPKLFFSLPVMGGEKEATAAVSLDLVSS